MVCTGKLNWVWIPPPSSKRRLQAAWKHKKKKKEIFVFLVFFCLGVPLGTEAQAEGAAMGRMGMVVTGPGGSCLTPWAAQPRHPNPAAPPGPSEPRIRAQHLGCPLLCQCQGTGVTPCTEIISSLGHCCYGSCRRSPH